jgi:polar amino acid transport system substrate-binding protein
MKMKKLLVVTLISAMVFTLAACSSKEADTATTEESTTDETATEETATEETTTSDATDATADAESALTLKDGVLQVGMEIGYPPMEYLDEDGTTTIGFDVEVAQALADELGLELEIVDTAWDGIFASLDSDRYDCIISAVSINDERKAAYNLTEAYVANRIVLVTPADAGITSPDELAGKSVAVQTETTSDEYMKSLVENGLELSDYYVYDKVIQCFDDLKVGRVDSVVTDSVVAAYYMGSDADKYEVAWESPDAEPMAICLKKGNDGLTQEIETAIDTLYSTGKMAEIAVKYFGYDVTEGVR